MCKANKELLTWSKHPRGTSKAPRCHPQGQVRAVVCWIRNRNRNRKRNRNLLRRVRQQLMPKVDIGARGKEEEREEEQGLESRDCASSRTAGGWRQTWRGVEVRVCMQLACLASRCGEGGEVEGILKYVWKRSSTLSLRWRAFPPSPLPFSIPFQLRNRKEPKDMQPQRCTMW